MTRKSVRAGAHALSRADDVDGAGDHHHLLVGQLRIVADEVEQRLAAAALHGDIGDDEVGQVLFREFVAGQARVGLDDLVAFLAQDHAEDGADGFLVVDDEDFGLGGFRQHAGGTAGRGDGVRHILNFGIRRENFIPARRISSRPLFPNRLRDKVWHVRDPRAPGQAEPGL